MGLGVRLFLLSSQSLSDSRCNLRATSRSPSSRRALPCRFFLCRVALLCLVQRRRRRLPVPCSRGFFRLSAQLRPPCCISWPLESIELSSRKDDSSDAHSYHLPPSHIIAQVHPLVEHLSLHGRCRRWGPLLGCIVTADKTGFPLARPPRSRLPRLPSARLYVRY